MADATPAEGTRRRSNAARAGAEGPDPYLPTPEEVDLLLTGFEHLVGHPAGPEDLDWELLEECQSEIHRLQQAGVLTGIQARAAVDLLYRWNQLEQSVNPVTPRAPTTAEADPPPDTPGLYPDPTGQYRKRWWTGSEWGTGVGIPGRARGDKG